MRPHLFSLPCLVVLACTAGAPTATPAAAPDATVPDATVPDAAMPDAAVPDTAQPDAGDGREADAGYATVPVLVTDEPLCVIPPGYVDAGGDPVRPPCRIAADNLSDRDAFVVPAELRFVTWNLEYGAASTKVLETLRNDPVLSGADFLALQEAPRNTLSSTPQRVDLTRLIAQQQKLNYVYAVEWDWRLMPDRQGEWGLAVLSKYPLTSGELIRHTPLRDRWADEQRYGGRATLAVTAMVAGRPLRLYSVHLDLHGGQTGRALQGSEVRAHAQQPGQPALQVVGGDFNTWECNPLTAACNVAPAAERVVQDFLLTWSDGAAAYAGYTQLGAGLLPQRLDWVFFRGASPRSGTCLTSAKGSDHFPLVFNFTPAP